VGPPSINVHDWKICHGESWIIVSSRCPDTFDQIVYVRGEVQIIFHPHHVLHADIHISNLQMILYKSDRSDVLLYQLESEFNTQQCNAMQQPYTEVLKLLMNKIYVVTIYINL
jgi:hypothetical protein